MNLSRRKLLAGVAIGTAAAAIAEQGAVNAAGKKKRYGMVIDLRKCFGCHACSVSCKAEQGGPLGFYKSWVIQNEKGGFPHVKRKFIPVLCNNCDDPACITVCPVDDNEKYEGTKATWKRPDGIVVVDEAECIGCGYCVYGCPYGMRYLDPRTDTAQKCDFCQHRVDQGLLPACVNTCNAKARIFGDLNDPSSEISKFIAKNKVQALRPFMGTEPEVFYVELDQKGYKPLGQVEPGLKGQFGY